MLSNPLCEEFRLPTQIKITAHEGSQAKETLRMKWIRLCTAIVATVFLTSAAQAGFGLFGSHGSCKSCVSAPSCQPESCKPTISRPCKPTIHTYQRKCSDIKPPSCDTACAPVTTCAPVCAAPVACAPIAPVCAAPIACAPKAPVCAAPVVTTCDSQPCGGGCGHGSHFKFPKFKFPKLKLHKFKMPKLGGHFGSSCTDSSCTEQSCVEQPHCDADPCEVAKLIYKSQTACYAKDREKAIDKLGDFDACRCNPEIMVAFIYALNDADEEVREEAADEIGDQIRKSKKEHGTCNNCCSPEVVAALTSALGDCDKGVRKQAEEALEACGYDIVDGNCETSCTTGGCGKVGCTSCGSHGSAPVQTAPAPAGKRLAPTPAPPEEPKAYFPSRNRKHRKNSLAGLFGLLN